MTAKPKQYEHISFTFNKSSMCLDGKSFDVTAYLLVPEKVMPELRKWEEMEAKDRDDRVKSHLAPWGMYKALKEKGALLHRTDGPAYEEIEKSASDKGYSKVVVSEFWEKGVEQKPVEQKPSDEPNVKRLGKFTL